VHIDFDKDLIIDYTNTCLDASQLLSGEIRRWFEKDNAWGREFYFADQTTRRRFSIGVKKEGRGMNARLSIYSLEFSLRKKLRNKYLQGGPKDSGNDFDVFTPVISGMCRRFPFIRWFWLITFLA